MNSIICTSYVIHLGNPKLYKELLKIVLQQKKMAKRSLQSSTTLYTAEHAINGILS